MIVSTSASTSTGLRAAHAFEQLVALELAEHALRPRRASNGGTRNVTSPNTSTKMPPRPTVTTGPNSSSCETPIEHLDAAGHHLAHEHAVDARALVAGLLRLASSSSYAARTSLRPTDADLHEARVALVQQVGRRHLHHDRDSRSPAAFTASAGRSRTARPCDVLMPYASSSCFERPLRERFARLQAVEQLARLLRRGQRRRRRVVERRAVARRERPVVGVGLHRRDAVVERAEHRQPAVEQALVVRVVGAAGAPQITKIGLSVVFGDGDRCRA